MMRMLGIKIALLAFAMCWASRSAAQSFLSDTRKIKADVIVVKFKPPAKHNGRIAAGALPDKLAQIVPAEEIYQVFKNRPVTNARLIQHGLDRIYKIKLTPGANIWLQLARLRQMEDIAYAEPFFQNELLYLPNDPEADPASGQQDYLSVVKAYDGWQIDQADSTMVIGIVDTGVNMAHEDLGNIAYNTADTLNGFDDDGDGYIDNYRGWDLADNDNDPTADGHPHGTPVAGISSATANNNIGMTGMGFHSRYLPVKVAQTATRMLMHEYEGIVYAADHGCKVINLSWGGANIYTKYGQDIIDYAVLEKDVVVVAAAGNTPAELDFYPASFKHVLSVGATDINDNLASWATYSHYIDIMAPGNNVYSTKNNGGYERTTGSSFSSPMVAGAAALVRSHFPDFSALQVMEQLRVTADDIYAVGSNMNYYGKLGKGRLNVQRALSDILTPSIRMSDFQYQGNHGQLVFPGDTVAVNFSLTNYLRMAENVTVTISNPSGNVNWQASQIHINQLGEMKSHKNAQNPMTFIVHNDLPPGERLLFRIDYVGNNYKDFEYFEINTVPEYFDFTDGHLSATVTSDGDLGFDDHLFRQGSGISFDSTMIADQIGLVVSTDSTHVMDNIINNYQTYSRDEDFVKESSIRLYDNSVADLDARSVFRAADTVANRLPVKVEQKILNWNTGLPGGAILIEYRIINTGNTTLNNLDVGIFADWDLGDFEANQADWDSLHNLGYTFEKTTLDHYAGIALLSNQTSTHRAIDIGNAHGNAPDIDTLFTDALKHQYLSGISPKNAAGTTGLGNDVAQIVGAHGMTLAPQQAVKVTLVLLAASSMSDLLAALDSAKVHYQQYLQHPPLEATYYACSGDSAVIDPAGNLYTFYADAAASMLLDSGTVFKSPPVSGPQMYYLVNHDSLYAGDVMSVMVRPGDPQAGFILPSDTLLIEQGKFAELPLQDTSRLTTHWSWDFGNGYTSQIASPVTLYDSSGTFSIQQEVSNDYGCVDSVRHSLFVAVRSDRPIVQDRQICKGISTDITAQNTNQITVYATANNTTKLFSGSTFYTGPIGRDTIFYVVNTAGTYPSVPVPVHVHANHPDMGFDIAPDTLSLLEKYALHVWNTVGNTDSLSWLVDGQPVGNDADFTIAYSSSPFKISQIKQDGTGCYDTLHLQVTPAYSPLPTASNITVCRGGTANLSPGNGTYFNFYEDPSLSVLLHKGKSWNTGQISADKTYYITNTDSLLEGAYATVQIKIDPVHVEIDVATNTLMLRDNLMTELQKNAQNSMTSYWLLEGGSIDTASVLLQHYQQAGSYPYTAVAQSASGCYDTAYQTITVVNITALQEALLPAIQCYPNPVQDELHLTFDAPLSSNTHLVLLDEMGRKIRQFSMYEGADSYVLHLDNLPAGMYVLRSANKSYPFAVRIVKR